MPLAELDGYEPTPLKSKLDVALDELEREGRNEVALSEQGSSNSTTHKALGEIRLSAVENIRTELRLMRTNLEQVAKPEARVETEPVMPPELRD